MKVVFDTKNMNQVASRLAKMQPAVFEKATSDSLLWGVSNIAVKSAHEGGKVARFEGHYQAGFRHTKVQGRPKNLWAKAYNIHGYSMIIEHGVKRWKVPPPVGALVDWAKGKLGLGEKEAKSFAYAFGRALTGKGNSKTAANARAGKARKALKVMKKVTMKLKPRIEGQFKKNYKKAFKVLKALGRSV